MNMTVSEAIPNIPELLPVLATLAGAGVTATVFLFNILKRRHLVEQIKNTELELKKAREGARAAVIVRIHDHLVKCQRDLRRTKARVKISGFVLLPFLAGGFFGTGHLLRTSGELERIEHMTAQFQKLEYEFRDSLVKSQTREDELVIQESEKMLMAKEVEAYAHEADTLQERLTKTQQLVATARKKRTEVEVLLGKAEQRLAGLEASQHPRKDASATFASAEETVSRMVSELSFAETDLLADDQKVFADHTSHYTGRLNGRIVFEGRQQLSIAPWSKPHIYVLVRWGVSTWIVTDSSPKVNSDGSVEGDFNVILTLRTIRALDVTAIATYAVYRRYQHVRFPEYAWKASAATIAVHRS